MPRGVAMFSSLALAMVGIAIPVVAVPHLDPSHYTEPDEGIYWGSGAESIPPFAVKRINAETMDRSSFDSRIMDGRVFVVEDFGGKWPMKGWDCDFFQKDPLFSKSEMQQHYVAGDGQPRLVGFKSGWKDSRKPSGASDTDAPQVAPFYWGIKDIQYSDANVPNTWKQSMLKKVQKHIAVPEFMDPLNHQSFQRTPEFWFAGGGAGAKAHMDSHKETTISIQLAGTKRWRLRMMEPRLAPYLAMLYQDGYVYKRRDKWEPHFNITLKPGEALFVPPGFVHETLNLGEPTDCAASVTFQFSRPMPVRMYRRFLPRILRTADIHEVWPDIRAWASLGNSAPKEGMTYVEARSQALGETGVGAVFSRIDRNKDDSISIEELEVEFGKDESRSYSGFHDLNEDGEISRTEFAEVFGFWAGTRKAVYEDTPKKYRTYLLKDMTGDFNIEDIPEKIQRKMQTLSSKLEGSRLATTAKTQEL